MPRLRNTATGVVVNVSADKAKRLDGYEAVETKAPAKKAEPSK